MSEINIKSIPGYERQVLNNTVYLRPKWIKISDQEPPKETSVLVYTYIGYEFEKNRKEKIYIARLFERFKDEYIWRIDCDCSGYECDPQFIEPIYWMPLPEEPKL